MKKKLTLSILTSCFAIHSATYALNLQQIMLNFKNSLAQNTNPATEHRKGSKATFEAINASVTTPNAVGSTENSLFVGLGYLFNDSHTHKHGANLIVGTSLGNAEKNLGVLVSISSPFYSRKKFSFNSHALSIRLNRYLNSTFSIAAGFNNLVGTGDFKDSSKSFYTVITGNFKSKYLPIMASVGVGSGGFNSIEDDTNGSDDHLSAFYNIGLGLTKNWSLTADWSAQYLSVGTTFIFHLSKNIPLGMNIAMLNIATTRSDPTFKNIFATSIAYAYTF